MSRTQHDEEDHEKGRENGEEGRETELNQNKENIEVKLTKQSVVGAKDGLHVKLQHDSNLMEITERRERQDDKEAKYKDNQSTIGDD